MKFSDKAGYFHMKSNNCLSTRRNASTKRKDYTMNVLVTTKRFK